MLVHRSKWYLLMLPGTNWMIEITKQLLYGHDDELIRKWEKVPLPLMLLEGWKPEKVELMKYVPLPRKSFGSHLPEELVNFEKIKKNKGKVVVMVRNPKDQAVSWFNFTKSNPVFDAYPDVFSRDWSQFFSDYVQGKHHMITRPGEWYPEYLLGWYKHKDEPNVMFLHFEVLKKHPKDEIRRLAEFLGIQLTEERLTAVVEATSFDAMKKEQNAAKTELTKIRTNINLVRKGQVGSWKNTFTVAQSELKDKIIEEKLGHTDIKFIYE